MSTSPAEHRPSSGSAVGKALLWVVVAATLVLVFTAYQNPHFLVGLADQLWSCF